MKTIDEKNIQSLLDKFMAGETTLQEENILGEYFRTSKKVKQEWEAYKSMFSYFDEGMPYENSEQKETRPGRIVKIIVGVISAAAIVALLFTFALPKSENDKQLANNNEPKKEVPVESNPKVEKAEESKEEAIEEKTEKKTETTISPTKETKKKRTPRLKFSIPAPQEYMAQTNKSDTLDLVDKELINSYLYQCASMDVAMDEIYTQEMYDEEEYITNEE